MSRLAPFREQFARTWFVGIAWYHQIAEFILLRKMDRLQHGQASRFDRWALGRLHDLMLRQVERMRSHPAAVVTPSESPTGTGVHNAAVQIHPSDPHWANAASAEIAALQQALGPDIIVHHIGSTAVESLDAKPIIDLALALPATDFDQSLRQAVPVLERLGYRYVGVRGGLFFEKGPLPIRTHALQAHAADSAVLTEILRFRAALRANAALRREYLAIKQTLAGYFPTQRMHYAVYKGHWIQENLWPIGDTASWSDWYLHQKQSRDSQTRSRRQN